MGNRSSKVAKTAKTANQTINKTANSGPTINKLNPTASPNSKDMGQEIAKNMNKLNLHAIITETKSLYNKDAKTDIPNIDKISIDTCKLLFKDAQKLKEPELASKYRLSVAFVKKLVESYEWPDNQVITKKSTTSFGRSDLK